MSTIDLLAVILGSPASDARAITTARKAVRRLRMERLENQTVSEWPSAYGATPAGAIRLAAAFELHRRLLALESRDPPTVSCPEDTHTQTAELRRARKEHLLGLYLDTVNRIIAKETISIGALNTTRTHPREILYPAIQHLALGFILVHNHPSGSLTPSVDDIEFTRSVRRAGEILGIELYDHVIVSHRDFVSLREKGLLWRVQTKGGEQE